MQGLTSPKAPLGGGLEVLERPPWPTPSRRTRYIRGSKELDVDLAAALRRLGGAGDLLGVLLVATPHRVTAVRGEAAVLALGALCHRRVERDDAVAGRAARAHRSRATA